MVSASVAINGDPTAVWRGFGRVRIDAHLLRQSLNQSLLHYNFSWLPKIASASCNVTSSPAEGVNVNSPKITLPLRR